MLERVDDRKKRRDDKRLEYKFTYCLSPGEAVQIGGTEYTTSQSFSDITTSHRARLDPLVMLTESLRQVAASWIAGVVYTEE